MAFRVNLPFEEAKKIVQSERIESVAQYKKWHNLNKPAGIPKRPDRAYYKDFTTWNNFLGNNNPFPIIRKTYRSFIEARAFAQSLNISTKQQWLDKNDDEKVPNDIPRRPDLYYRNKDEWVSWANFLGLTLLSKEETILKLNNIFYIIFNPGFQRNYFKCGITNGGISSINDYIHKSNTKLVCAYFVPNNFNPEEFIINLGGNKDYEHNGFFFINNLTAIISKLSVNFNKVPV
jgi:hypothetical protein